MFEYSDPSGQDFLGNTFARDFYRAELERVHQQGARVPNSAFTLPEAFSGIDPSQQEPTVVVEWPGFPVTAGQSDPTIDANRFLHQDEYVEWETARNGAGDLTVTFTTEFPEYFEAFAKIGFEALREVIRDVIPDADPTPEELFGPGVAHDALSPDGRADRFRGFRQSNPWNNGEKGVLCLTQQFNTLGALVNLLVHCSVARTDVDPSQICTLVGGFCGQRRNSDPRISVNVQNAARADLVISAADPVGISIERLGGRWTLDGVEVDIATASTDGLQHWTIGRNGRRAEFRLPAGVDLRLDNAPVVSGAQLSRVLVVASRVTAARSALVPVWARAGNEPQVPIG